MNTPKTLKKFKTKHEKIVALTCYNYFNAKIFDEIGIDVLLVGDSLGNVILGYENTLPVTMNDIIHHTKAVKRGIKNSLLVADMPYMSYQPSNKIAAKNAKKLIQAGAQAVKLEGSIEIIDRIKTIINSGVPVMGHLGLLPQSAHKTGGYRVHGKHEKEAEHIIKSAQELEKIGVFAIVLECIPESLGKKISSTLKIPTIGIGAGRFCDGQILVFEDIVNLTFDSKKKFIKIYDDLGTRLKKVAIAYKQDVKKNKFPTKKNIF